MRGTSTIKILLVLWATFALHVAVPDKFEFGDIIAVGRSKDKAGKPYYTHWAVYVGKDVEGLKNKNKEEDIFHIYSVPNIKMSDCVFGKMGDEQYVKSNYLDIDQNGNGRPKNIRAVMIQTINDLYHNCGRKWNPFSNNCEHVATYIRYGFKNCEQRGTRLPKWLRNHIVQNPANRAGKRSLVDLLDRDSRLAAAGA